MYEVLGFLGECRKNLGRPEQVQPDNARELAGWGPSARTLSRVIRLCLGYGVSPVFIPEGESQLNGSTENFNGWFQESLFQQHFRRPCDLQRELGRIDRQMDRLYLHGHGGSIALVPWVSRSRSLISSRRHKGRYA